MRVRVVVSRIKEDWHTTTFVAAVVNDILHKHLDQVSRNTTGSLEERAFSSPKFILGTRNMFTVLVGAVGVNILDRSEYICWTAKRLTALATTLAVDAQSRSFHSKEGNDCGGLKRIHLTGISFNDE